MLERCYVTSAIWSSSDMLTVTCPRNGHSFSDLPFASLFFFVHALQVKWDHLHGALDRFSAFFISPRFDNRYT